MAEEDIKNKYDVAIIGAGPAGMMAAGQAASFGQRVVLIDKNSNPGKKLLLTGNGRCNLTNAEFNLKNLTLNYNNGEFLFHAFSVFGPKETIDFFEKLGVKTKAEAGNRVFPAKGGSEKVLETLEKYLAKNNVEMLFSSEIIDIERKGKNIAKIILHGREIIANKYILCTGGKAYPLTGSAGSGYEIAKKLGHTIVAPLPALSPIKLKEEWTKNLQAITLKDAKINVFQNNKKISSEEGDIMFTHFGISGPAVLNISSKVIGLLKTGDTKILIDIFPLLNQEQLLKGLEDEFKKYARQTIKNVLSSFVPERLAEVLLDVIKINKNKMANSISKIEKSALVKILKNIEATPADVLDFDNAMVTRGGVSLKEIDHKTMKSKIIDNLFFAGEIIDVDGKTGGFNLQMCWSTGYLAGQNSIN